MSDLRNTDLPRGPKADALGTLLYHLYQDILDGKIEAEQYRGLWVIKSWRGLHLVHVEAAKGGLQVVFWIEDDEAHPTIENMIVANVEAVPTWIADRIRMIWVELGQKSTVRCLSRLTR